MGRESRKAFCFMQPSLRQEGRDLYRMLKNSLANLGEWQPSDERLHSSCLAKFGDAGHDPKRTFILEPESFALGTNTCAHAKVQALLKSFRRRAAKCVPCVAECSNLTIRAVLSV